MRAQLWKAHGDKLLACLGPFLVLMMDLILRWLQR